MGEKTARKLILKYGCVENLIEHLDELPGSKIKSSIENNEQQALMTVICLEGSTFQDEPCVDRYIYHAGLFMLRFKRCNWKPLSFHSFSLHIWHFSKKISRYKPNIVVSSQILCNLPQLKSSPYWNVFPVSWRHIRLNRFDYACFKRFFDNSRRFIFIGWIYIE